MPESVATIKLVGKDLASSEVKKAEITIKQFQKEVASAEQIAQKFRKTVSAPINSQAAKETASLAEHMKKAEAETTKAARTLAGMEAEAKRLTAEFRKLEVGTDAFVKKGKELNSVNKQIQDIKKSTGEIPKTGIFGQLAGAISIAAISTAIFSIGV